MTRILNDDRAVGADKASYRWRALRVSAAPGVERLEELLVTTVHPWVTTARATGALDGWFLERPGGGAELRLALQGVDDQRAAELRQQLVTFLDGQHGAAVADEPYDPDTARYGGPHATAVWAEYATASSATAVATIRATRSHAKRLRAAGGLLLASAWATGADWRDAVTWLRSYASSRAGVGDTRTADVSRARAAAEAAYLRNEAEWLRHHDEVRAAVAAPNSTVGGWHRRQCATWSALVELHEAGRLTAPPAAVFGSLVELTHHQLGLRPEDEAYLAWLLSMPLVAPAPREPFFADGPGAVDRQLHEQSKFFPTRLEDQRPDLVGATSTGRQELGPVLERVPMHRPEGVDASAPRLEEVLLARRSAYGHYRGPVTLDELSALLYYSAAETAEKTMPGSDLTLRLRTYPSGGGRYPLRLLVYCHDVAGLRRGTYFYDPQAHALDLLSSEDISDDLMRMSPATDPRVETPPKAGGKIHAVDCPVWILVVADLTYQRLHYGLRSYRLVLAESGHLGQNLSLVSTWLGKSSVGLGGFHDDVVNQAVHLDGVNSGVIYVYLVGTVSPDP